MGKTVALPPAQPTNVKWEPRLPPAPRIPSIFLPLPRVLSPLRGNQGLPNTPHVRWRPGREPGLPTPVGRYKPPL